MRTAPDQRPRTVITTDGEVDDQNSLIRALLYANDFDLAGIVLTSSRYHYAGDVAKGIEPFRWTGASWSYEMIDRYEACYRNLRVHDPRYPEASYLRKRTFIGNVSYEGEMDEVTAGSEFLAELFLDDDPRTLYVQTWGGTNTTARALKSIEERYAGTAEWAEVREHVSRKLVIYLILDQDESYSRYIAPNWPNIQVLNDASNFWHFAYAWQLHPAELNRTLQGAWQKKHIAEAGGPFAEAYALMGDGKLLPGELPEEQRGSDEYLEANPNYRRNDFISEGDSPSFLYLVDRGLRQLEDPSFGGWGGRFGADGRNSVADYDPFSGRFEASYTLTRWFDDLQADFAARLVWCTAERFEDAPHAPKLRILEGNDLRVNMGDRVTLTAEALPVGPPCGEPAPKNRTQTQETATFTYRWWRYFEADSFADGWTPDSLADVSAGGLVLDRVAEPPEGVALDTLRLEGAQSAQVSFVIPEIANGCGSIHLVCEAASSSAPELKTYQRVVVNVE